MEDKVYGISELAKEFDITTRAIRFYEEKGLIAPYREGQKRIYSAADRVRIQLILRGKRIGMTLQESAEVIDLYDPDNNNTQQLHALIETIEERRSMLIQQKSDIEEMLSGLDEVQSLCQASLKENDNPGEATRRATTTKR